MSRFRLHPSHLSALALTVGLLAGLSAFAMARKASASMPTAVHTTAERPTNYCNIPLVENPPWGFHAGAPISGATGSYARGHGDINLSAKTASGVICQVDRVRDAPDRQIVLSVGHHLVYASHHAVMYGVPGNVMKIDVRVRTSTDSQCPVGTTGEVTIFASYNGVHRDSVRFAFPAACRRHRHLYRGNDVVTNVPPE